MLPCLGKHSSTAKVSQGFFAKFPKEQKNRMKAPLLSPLYRIWSRAEGNSEFCKHREKEQVEQSANYPSPRSLSDSDINLASSEFSLTISPL